METLVNLIFVFSIITFGVDYLSNKYITHSELKIGILNFLHHLIHNCMNCIPLLLFFNIDKYLLLVIGTLFVINNGLWIFNNDHCFLTEYVNTITDPETKYYKWRSSFTELIKHYIRGDSWGYSPINNYNRDTSLITMNVILIIISLKKILLKNNE